MFKSRILYNSDEEFFEGTPFKGVNVVESQKAGYIEAEVAYSDCTRTFTRKNVNDSFIIEGFRIRFSVSSNTGLVTIKDLEQLYGTAGKKVSSTAKKSKHQTAPKQIQEVLPIKAGEVFHNKFGQIKKCIECNIPVYLAGPAGSGKNHTLEQIAKFLELDFYFTNSVQQEFKITGFIDAGGVYHETEFYKAFKNGGLFFLDEMDASVPEVLVLLNAAIANGYFEFPTGRIQAHPNFRVVSAGNTVGSGADDQYTGRMVLDQATLDRFVIIDFDYDKAIELQIAKGNEALISFIRSCRKSAKTNGVRATFSYRCISQVTKLEEAGLDIKTILEISVFKGLDKDTIKTFNVHCSNKYSDGLQQLKA